MAQARGPGAVCVGDREDSGQLPSRAAVLLRNRLSPLGMGLGGV
jgi:hypothetical protein